MDHRRPLAAIAVLVTLGVACHDLPVQVRAPGPTPSRSVTAGAVSGCAARTRAERVQALREMLAALPPAAALVVGERLLPALATVQEAVSAGHAGSVGAAVQRFVAGVESLRLRAPFEQREALVAEAECLLGGAVAAGGPPA